MASRRTCGVPRIHAELRRLGHRVNRKRVARRKHRSLTRPDTRAKPAPDLIGRDFHAERPGTRLVGDITYLPTAEGWLYLARRLDQATRGIVGYAGRPPPRRARRRPPRQRPRPRRSGARMRDPQQSRQRVHIDTIPQPSARFEAVRELRTHRIMCHQRRSEEFLGPAQGQDRNPETARPGHARTEVFTFIATFHNRRRLPKRKTFGYLTPTGAGQRHQHTLAA
ncbi:hypothetical protein RJT17_36810 [Streptomyces sp. P5-A9]|uniref:IS3 family transposase n=1 Tax=Streptomyces sp. P5-A9 TaxID=3071730 RepID=UPI002FC5EFD6